MFHSFGLTGIVTKISLKTVEPFIVREGVYANNAWDKTFQKGNLDPRDKVRPVDEKKLFSLGDYHSYTTDFTCRSFWVYIQKRHPIE